jgi:hypothetical protein
VLLMIVNLLPETRWAAFTRLNNKIFYNWVCIWFGWFIWIAFLLILANLWHFAILLSPLSVKY